MGLANKVKHNTKRELKAQEKLIRMRMAAGRSVSTELLRTAGSKMEHDMEKDFRENEGYRLYTEWTVMLQLQIRTYFGFGKKRLHDFLLSWTRLVDGMQRETYAGNVPTAPEIRDAMMDECGYDLKADMEAVDKEVESENRKIDAMPDFLKAAYERMNEKSKGGAQS